MTTPVNTHHGHASQHYLAAIVNCSDDAIIGLSVDGRILSWNRGAEKLYGFIAEEARGKDISIIVPADRADEFRRIAEMVKRGETIDHFRTVGVGKNGRLLDVSIATSPIKDESGTIIGFSTIARNITERKKIEDALVQRNRELLTFHRLSEIIHSHGSLDESYLDIVKEICAATGFPIGAIGIYDEPRQMIVFHGTTGLQPPFDLSKLEAPIDETFSGIVIRTGKPLIESHVPEHPDIRSEILRRAGAQTYVGYPIIIRHRVAGALVLGHVQRVEIDAGTASWMESLANYIGELTDRKQGEDDLRRSREDFRQLSTHLQSAIEEERKRIAREIHDELGQQLSLLQLECGLIEDRLRIDQTDLRERTQSMTKLIDSTILSVQRISADLRPSLLDNLGIGAAVEWLAKGFKERTGIACEASVDPPDMKLDQDRSIALFRIFQEALTNVARHARATNVKARLTVRNGCVILKVQDNGIGISPDRLADAHSFGLIGMRERVHLWEGNVEINGKAGEGTAVTVTIPLEA